MKLVKIITILALTTSIMAAGTTGSVNTTTASSSSVLKKLRDSDYSFYYLNESVARNVGAKEVNALSMYHILYFGYKIDKNHTIKVVPTFTTSYKSGNGVDPAYSSTQLRFYRNNILTEEKHGINLNVQVRNYLYDGKTQSNEGYDTKHRLYILPSKSFGKISVSSGIFTEFYARSGSRGIVRNDYLSVNPSFEINDNLSINVGLDYYHRVMKGSGSFEQVSLTLPGLDFSNGRFYASVSTAFIIMKSNDKSVIVKDWYKSTTAVLDLSYSLF